MIASWLRLDANAEPGLPMSCDQTAWQAEAHDQAIGAFIVSAH